MQTSIGPFGDPEFGARHGSSLRYDTNKMASKWTTPIFTEREGDSHKSCESAKCIEFEFKEVANMFIFDLTTLAPPIKTQFKANEGFRV